VRPNKYFIAAVSAFLMWGFFSLALRPLHAYASLDILFFRVFYATALLLLINASFRRKALKADWSTLKSLPLPKRRPILVLVIAGGFLLVANWYLFIHAVNHVSLKSASFAYLICPIMTTILAFFILKEKLSRWQWFAVLLSLGSCIILSFGNLTDLAYSLVIALTFAVYLISQRRIGQFDRFIVLTVQMAVAALVMLPFFPLYGGAVPREPLFYTMLTLIVVFFTIVPLFLNLYALKGMNSSTVGILMYTNPLVHFLLAVCYFGEAVSTPEAVAYGLILFSIVVFNERILFRRKLQQSR
jgi:chloramphenicol-sensitive protein RarD